MIASVLEQGSSIYIFNEHGERVSMIMGGVQDGDGLRGWTATCVSVKRGPLVYVYDESGEVMTAIPG